MHSLQVPAGVWLALYWLLAVYSVQVVTGLIYAFLEMRGVFGPADKSPENKS